MTVSPLLILNQVTVTDESGFDTLLAAIDLTIQPGERLGITGKSGAGKSTLLRVLNGLHSITRGEILYQGKPLTTFPPPQLRQEIMLIPQEPKLLGMTVSDSLRYPLVLQKLTTPAIQKRVETACERWQIPTDWLDRNELQLSVGQRQLVTLARGALVRSPVLLLDEPTASLDPVTANRVIEQLIQLNQTQGTTILMVNHTPEYLEQFSQRQIQLMAGQLVA